jgi:hypothetical protein
MDGKHDIRETNSKLPRRHTKKDLSPKVLEFLEYVSRFLLRLEARIALLMIPGNDWMSLNFY